MHERFGHSRRTSPEYSSPINHPPRGGRHPRIGPWARCDRANPQTDKIALARPSGMRQIPGSQRRRKDPAMAYDLENFIADCRALLSSDPGPGGREKVRAALERLLGNADFVRRVCGEGAPRGLKVLYEDPGLGFQILAHLNENARTSPPHDHGASWAIYGQATQYTDMTEWGRLDDGADPDRAKLQPMRQYRLMPGQAGIYQEGAIHSIDYPAKACFIRVTGTNLDRIPRRRFDLATGAATQMTPQQAT